MRLALVPRSNEFFDLFAHAGANAREAALLAERRFREYPDTSVAHSRVKDIETDGDRTTAELIRMLNTQYVTPFDREDIYGLARAIDDVVDHIENASELLDLYKVEAPMEQAVRQCAVLVAASGGVADALGGLRGLNAMQAHIDRIKELEDEGDRLVRDAMASLFEDDDVSPRTIIRWKDIFEALESAIDACETVAHLVGNIAVKHG